MKSLVTLSIGIPAHNEEGNIISLLESILNQTGNFELEKILVICDGCTDGTSKLVQKFSKKHNIVSIIDDKIRIGKASRLNQLYKWNQSELLVTLDADLVLGNNEDLNIMIEEMYINPDTNVVGGNFFPLNADTFWGRCAVFSFLSFKDAILRLNNGNNYYSLIGGATMIKGSYAKDFEYPLGVISDMNYLYKKATENSEYGVRLAHKTKILFRTVDSFRDWRILGIRSVKMDKENLTQYLGKDVLQKYKMPLWISLTSLVKWWWINPFYMTGSIMLNIFIRLFPLQSLLPKNGIWEETSSSKKTIILSNHD